MSEMVERVARAILYRQVKAHGVLPEESAIQSYVNDCWRDCKDDARTAIEAMREPTEAMIKAGNCRPYDEERAEEMADSNTGMTWQAMIDAALPADTP